MLLAKENIRNYSGFCKDLSGYYIIFMNYIAALTLTKKILLLQFLSECSIEARPSKNKIFKWKSIPSTYPFIYHHQKAKTTFFATQKLLRVMRLLRVLLDRVPFKVFGEGFLFRVITKRSNFRVLSDSVLLGFSVIRFSLGFSVVGFYLDFSVVGSYLGSLMVVSSLIDSPLGSSVILFWCATFLSKRATTLFYWKLMFCFRLYFKKWRSHLTISWTCLNYFDKTDSKNMKKYLHDRNTKYYIENTCHQFSDLYIAYYNMQYMIYIA